MVFAQTKAASAQYLRALFRNRSQSKGEHDNKQGPRKPSRLSADLYDPIGEIYRQLAMFHDHRSWHHCNLTCASAPDPVRGIIHVIACIEVDELDEYLEVFFSRLPEDVVADLVDELAKCYRKTSSGLKLTEIPRNNKTREENLLDAIRIGFLENDQVVFRAPLLQLCRCFLTHLSAGKTAYYDDLPPRRESHVHVVLGMSSMRWRGVRNVLSSELWSLQKFLDDYGDIVLMYWEVSKMAVDRFVERDPELLNDQSDSEGSCRQSPAQSSRDRSEDIPAESPRQPARTSSTDYADGYHQQDSRESSTDDLWGDSRRSSRDHFQKVSKDQVRDYVNEDSRNTPSVHFDEDSTEASPKTGRRRPFSVYTRR